MIALAPDISVVASAASNNVCLRGNDKKKEDSDGNAFHGSRTPAHGAHDCSHDDDCSGDKVRHFCIHFVQAPEKFWAPEAESPQARLHSDANPIGDGDRAWGNRKMQLDKHQGRQSKNRRQF
jgi:hypothetical protein